MTLLALVITASAVVSALAVAVGTRSWRTALLVLVELLTAAGLLHLVVDLTWTQIATAATAVAVRKAVVMSLRASPRVSGRPTSESAC